MARRLAAGLTGVVLAAGALAVTASPAGANPTFAFTRYAGADQFGTAAQLAAAAFPSGATEALLANGSLAHFADALSASYVAGYVKAPILLTDTNDIPSETSAALSALNVENIVIVGGTDAVSAAEASTLSKDGYHVARVGGATRYDTAAALAAIPPAGYVGTGVQGVPTAVVASGADFPDALVSGPMGYGSAFPIEITDPNSLSAQTAQSLKSLGIQYVLIPGGTAAVSAAVQSQIQALGIQTLRFSGVDRTDTAAQVASYEVANLGFSSTTVDLARGDDPSDSLAGAPYGGVTKTPLLLSEDPSDLGTHAATYLSNNSVTLASGAIFGGTAAVSSEVQAEATAAAQDQALVSVTASSSTLPGNGYSTSTVTVTVTGPNGLPTPGDGVQLAIAGSPAAACGTLSATSGTTNTNGQMSVTYTSADAAGTCTITAQEADTDANGSAAITQTTVDSVTVTASPTTVPANGTSTSLITATITNPSGGPVAGDDVTFSASPDTTGACGNLSTWSEETNSSGQSAVTYQSSTASGFCTVVAIESQTGAGSSVEVTQTASPAPATPSSVSVAASPTSVPANGKATSSVMVTVTRGGTAVSGDPVSLSTSSATRGACGAVSPTSGTTNSSGQFTSSYTASTTAGTCTVTATESQTGATGSTPITQTATDTVTVKDSSATVTANGASTDTITATVTNGSADVSGDAVTFAVGSPEPSGACGNLSSGAAGSTPAATYSTTTNSSGVATATYISSSTAGFCTVTATESATSSSGTVEVVQTSPSPTPPSAPAADTVTVSANPSQVIATGSATSSVTATVTSGAKPISGDAVVFLTGSGSPSAQSCGSVAPGGQTNSSGQVTVTYTASTTQGTCTVTATESDTQAKGSTVITQTGAGGPVFRAATVTQTGSPSNPSTPTTSNAANGYAVLTYSYAISCSTVDSDGSQFAVSYAPTGGGAGTVSGAFVAFCYDSTTNAAEPSGLATTSTQVILEFTYQPPTGDTFTFTAQDGDTPDQTTVGASSSLYQPIGNSISAPVST